jgi:hypothetical protein
MNSKRAYRLLLRLYPPDHRAVFSSEMLAAFDESAAPRRNQGWPAFARFILAELAGLVTGAGAEWLAKWIYNLRHSNSYISSRGLPDRLLMRPAGVSWDSYYRANAAAASNLTCVNAQQTFAFGSALRRLLLLACRDSCQCIKRTAPLRTSPRLTLACEIHQD